MSKENKNENTQGNGDLAIVRQRCLSVINTIAPTTELDEQLKGWLDDLDFVEIIMEAELQFDCKIEEGERGIDDFEKVSDLVDWLASNVA